MKRQKTRQPVISLFTAVLLSVTAALSLCSCSDSADTQQNSNTPAAPYTEQTAPDSDTSTEQSAAVLSDTPEPEESDRTVSVIYLGSELELTGEQKDRLFELAMESVADTDTMLNTLISNEEYEEAQSSGIYVQAIDNTGETPIQYNLLIVDGVGAASTGGSKHLVSGEIVGEVYTVLGV